MLTFLTISYYVFMVATAGLGMFFFAKKKGIFKIYGASVTAISFIQFPISLFFGITRRISNEFVFYFQEILNLNGVALLLLSCHLYMLLAWVILIIKR